MIKKHTEPTHTPRIAVEEVTGERVARRSATGGGDTRHTRTAGIPTIEFAVGTDTFHAVDEYTTVSALLQNTLVYTRLPSAVSHQLQHETEVERE